MIRKKVCMLGAFAVGKTSLVRQFVSSMFSERYQTTVGVKVDKKVIESSSGPMTLILWDLHGEDEFQKLRLSYLRGSSGFVIVADGTRPATVDLALSLRERVTEEFGPLPFVLLLNKCDLEAEWELEEGTVERLATQGITVFTTSAKTGEGVEEAFLRLADHMGDGRDADAGAACTEDAEE